MSSRPKQYETFVLRMNRGLKISKLFVFNYNFYTVCLLVRCFLLYESISADFSHHAFAFLFPLVFLISFLPPPPYPPFFYIIINALILNGPLNTFQNTLQKKTRQGDNKKERVKPVRHLALYIVRNICSVTIESI